MIGSVGRVKERGGGEAGGPGPGKKYRSTLAKIQKIVQENDINLINTNGFLESVFFAGKKAPAGAARPSTRGLKLSLSLP